MLIFRGVFGKVTPGVIEYLSMLKVQGWFIPKSQHQSLICEICTVRCLLWQIYLRNNVCLYLCKHQHSIWYIYIYIYTHLFHIQNLKTYNTQIVSTTHLNFQGRFSDHHFSPLLWLNLTLQGFPQPRNNKTFTSWAELQCFTCDRWWWRNC